MRILQILPLVLATAIFSSCQHQLFDYDLLHEEHPFETLPDSLPSIVSPELYEVLSESWTAVWYPVKRELPSLSYEYIPLDEPALLSDNMIFEIKYVLMRDRTYTFSSLKKQLFFPDIAIEFRRNEQTLTILISFSTEEVYYLFGEERRLIDVSPGISNLQELLNPLINK